MAMSMETSDTTKYQYWLNKYNEWKEGDPKYKAIRLLRLYTGEEGFGGSIPGVSLFRRVLTWRHHIYEISAAIREFEKKLNDQQAFLRNNYLSPDSYIKSQDLGDILKDRIDWSRINKKGDFYALVQVLARYCECECRDQVPVSEQPLDKRTDTFEHTAN